MNADFPLKFKCPDCAKSLAPMPKMTVATTVARRKCRCGAHWQIVVRPLAQTRPGMWMDEGTLTRIPQEVR